MSQQTLPRRRVASPPLIPTAEISRLPVTAPTSVAEFAARNAGAARSNIGRAVAGGTLPKNVMPGREISRVDRRERR